MVNNAMTQYGNLEQLRRQSVASIVQAAGVMADINRGEVASDYTEAQTRRLNALEPFITQREKAEIDRLEQEADRLKKLNPGSVEAQAAETRLRNAQAGALDRAAETFGLDKQLLEERLREAQRKNELVFDMPDGKGGTIKLSVQEGLDYLRSIPDSRGSSGQPTAEQIYQRGRQSREDAQRDETESTESENKIRNNPNLDVSGEADKFNSRSIKPYVYMPSKEGEFGAKPNRVAKIPLPKRKDVSGNDKQYTAKELSELHRTRFSGMTFKEFLIYIYRDVVKQPVPKELLD